jgi:glycosyltransferase involved in cell wall biosynthesis
MVPALIAFGLLSCAGWLVFGWLVVLGLRRIRLLAAVLATDGDRSAADGARTAAHDPGLPALSVVVTARDEAGAVEMTVRRLLAQRYPGLEVVVVDDRSTDGTSEILDRLAAAAGGPDDRLVVVHNSELPDGWLGKCHACRVGAGRARGDWILFTDGDVSLEEDDLLARVVGYAQRHGLDHLAVIPDLRPMSPAQAGLVGAFGQLFIAGCRAYEMDRDLPRGGGGIGAFNLVRRAVYERVGGHRLLRMDLADDFKLGRLLKEAGARQRIFSGTGLVRCPWHRGARAVIRGLEKNFFSAFDFSILRLVAATCVLLILTVGPALAGALVTWHTRGGVDPLVLAAAWLPLTVQAVFVLLSLMIEAPRHGFPPLVLWAFYPLSVLLLLGAVWNSAIRTLGRGGVVWRDTFYPLADLRAGIVPPGAGRRFHRSDPGTRPSGMV